MENKDRILYFDVLRAIAAVGVIFIHVSSNNWYGYIGTADWITFTVYDAVFRIAVPIFFMISGALFLNSKREKSIKELYLHSIGKLILFLIFWSIVYKLVYTPANEEISIKKIIFEIITGDTQTHLWFVYAIIGLYILVPLMRPVVKNSSKMELLYIIITCFVLESVYELAGYFDIMQIVTINLHKIKSGISLGYIGYFLLGAYIDKYNIEKNVRKVIYIFGAASMAITIGLVLYDCISTQTLNGRFWSYTMPNIYISSASLFLFIKNMNLKDNIIYKFLSAISRKSLGIYGVHFLFIIIFWNVGFDTFSFCGILSVPIISLCVLLLSFVTSLCLEKIPIIGKYIA